MKDEIKEIIDYLGNDKNYNCDCNDGSYYLELPYREAHELKDCITNLQEELKYQKEAEQEYSEKHTKLMKKYKELLEENESNINRIHELEEEIDSEYVQKEYYKSRCEKAREKLESIRVLGLRSGKTLFSTLIDETIDILDGDDND